MADNLLVGGSSDKGMSMAVKLGGSGDVTASNIIWRAEDAASNFALPLIHQGCVYFVNKVGVTFLSGPQNGQRTLARAYWR